MAQSTAKKKKTAAAPASGRGKRTAATTASAVEKKKPIRRQVGAAVCAFLALCVLFAIFGHDAVVLKWLWYFCRGLVGWGTWLLPLLLLSAALKLFFHRGRPVRLRVTCTLLLAPLAGALVHLIGDKTEYALGFQMFGALYTSGTASTSGGVLGGTLAVLLRSGLGTALSVILLALLILGDAAAAYNPQLKRLIKYLSERERPEYEPEPEPETLPVKRRGKTETPASEPAPEAASAPAGEKEKTAAIDIPGPGAPSRRELRREKREAKKLLRERAVATPDEVMNGIKESAAPSEPNYGRLPIDMPSPRDPVPPLEMRPGLNDDPASGETSAPEEAAAAEDDMPPFLEEEPSDEVEFEAPREEAPSRAPTLRPAGKTTHEPKIVDTLGGSKADAERREREAAVSAVAAEVAAAHVASETGAYAYPSVELLNEAPPVAASDASGEMRLNAQRLADTLRSFGIDAKINNVTRGPSITRYELELDRGVKLSKLSGLADDIALSLGAAGVRIAPIPDKVSIVGIEVPNKTVATVSLREIIESREFGASKSPVSFALGRDISGAAMVGDIEKLPHLLIAGTTGSGKSVCMNSLIISLLYKSSPDEVKLIMVDPKMIELNVYNKVPHLLIPVVTDPKKAAGALQWAVGEMMNRYGAFREAAVRNITEYNDHAERNHTKKMPRIVILIDELADLMLVAAKEVEESICRIAQMARAAGMHLVIATQSPRADVITGIMKANIPSRIAFAVASSLESRIIMDTPGAEKLVGRGDMLYVPVGSRKSTRIQGCFVSSEEVERVVDFIKNSSGAPTYSEEVINQIEKASQEGTAQSEDGVPDGADDRDEMFSAAVEVLLETGQASVSMLQRRLKLGYARAARLVDQLERRGIVGPFEGAKPRQLLITREEWEEMKLQNPDYQ